MSQSNTRLNIVIALLVINLLVTLWLGLAANARIGKLEQAQLAAAPEAIPLPEVLDNTVRTRLYRAFVVNYNAGDYDAVYDMFGSYAQERIQREALVGQFDRLVSLFGDIEDGSYSHHEYENRAQGVDFIHLIYDITLTEQSQLGQQAELIIKVLVKGDRYEIYGITLNAN